MRSFYIATIVFVSFFLSTACGGTDCEGTECFEPTDEISVTDDEEIADETTDETADEVVDEIVVDEEPDEDNAPVVCEENENCKEICKNFLEFAGKWDRVESTGYVILTLSVEDSICRISVTGKWTFEWRGTEIPLECAEYAPASYFFYLVGMENGKMLWFTETTKEGCETVGEANLTFIRK